MKVNIMIETDGVDAFDPKVECFNVDSCNTGNTKIPPNNAR